MATDNKDKQYLGVHVIFEEERGLVIKTKEVPVFNNRRSNIQVKKGLGKIVGGSYVDKGTYGYAEMYNVLTTVPKDYMTLDFHKKRGLPKKVETLLYGANVFLVEEGLRNTSIVGYNTQGEVIYIEKKLRKDDKPNISYNRVIEVNEGLKDITDELHEAVLKEFYAYESDLGLDNEEVQKLFKALKMNYFLKTENGSIIAQGKYESLLVWGNEGKVNSLWFGTKIDSTGKEEDITEKIRNIYE